MVAPGTTVTAAGEADDNDGDLVEHWLEVRRPAGDWSSQGWLTDEPWGPQLWGDGYHSSKSGTITLTDVGTYTFRTRTIDTYTGQWVYSNQVNVAVGTETYSTPAYEPWYWNDWGQIQYTNNCYNYSNNKRTDTFAQPGRASGNQAGEMTADAVRAAAISDGLELTDRWSESPSGKTKIALVIWPGWDYHWYRKDSNGLWTHKPGSTEATNLDNSGQSITNPETCNRGGYTVFAAYFFTPSDSVQGDGRANIW